MKTLYIINSKEQKYHKEVLTDFMSVAPGDVIDLAEVADLGSKYIEIEQKEPDLIITFDLAGHVFRTESDTLSLNNVYARTANILFHKTDHYGRDLKARQNLSMFTFTVKGEDVEKCREHFDEVPNISEFAAIDYNAQTDVQHEENRRNLALWLEEFKREAML